MSKEGHEYIAQMRKEKNLQFWTNEDLENYILFNNDTVDCVHLTDPHFDEKWIELDGAFTFEELSAIYIMAANCRGQMRG
jgi:hypothetical protein